MLAEWRRKKSIPPLRLLFADAQFIGSLSILERRPGLIVKY